MVQMVSMISSTKRDNENREKQGRANKGPTFTQVLKKVAEDNAPKSIINITYDSKSNINIFYHQSKEYTF